MLSWYWPWQPCFISNMLYLWNSRLRDTKFWNVWAKLKSNIIKVLKKHIMCKKNEKTTLSYTTHWKHDFSNHEAPFSQLISSHLLNKIDWNWGKCEVQKFKKVDPHNWGGGEWKGTHWFQERLGAILLAGKCLVSKRQKKQIWT